MRRPYGGGVPWQPHPHEVPAALPAPGLIWHDDDVAVVLDDFRVYSDMFEFTVVIMRHRADKPPGVLTGTPRSHLIMYDRPDDGTVPDDFLRVGLLLADGRKVTNLDDHPSDADLVLVRGGGTRGYDSEEQALRLWPLPPPGRLELVLEWPAYGTGELRVPLDADAIRAAATQAVRVWP